MALINTTNTVDTSIHLKAKLVNNMVGENWYLQNLQDKRNQDWEYRYNVVDIEEEVEKQIYYTKELPCYTPIQAVIQTVHNDRGTKLGDDWASLSFKDLQHPNRIGQRYRFDYDYLGEGMEKLFTMSEEDKYYNTSIWVAVNKSGISAGNSLVVRRCNVNVALLGSPTRSYDNITEARYEPGVLENELKMINLYYNQTVVIPQAEWYLTMQLNYFTNFIKINDRVILGGTDTEDASNNSVFKVKAVVKTNSLRTFAKFGSYELENIPLIIVGLDRDVASQDDDFYKRIAVESPIYPVQEIPEEYDVPVGDYMIQISEPNDTNILLGQDIEKEIYLANEDEKIQGNFDFDVELLGIDEKLQYLYYIFEVIYDEKDNNLIKGFKIKNLKKYEDNYLVVTCKTNYSDKEIENKFYFELGGFY